MECRPCNGCNLACQRGGNHADCKFNIKNSGIMLPNIPRYTTPKVETIKVEGKEITYKPGRLEFDPSMYIEANIAAILEKLSKILLTKM